jgi:L-alanine-DL-glutamate epimerase-like enolase superfamily enzyme
MATRVLDERHYLLVEVATSDGPPGVGYSYAGTSGGPMLAQAVRELLAPVLRGADEHDVTGLWERMYQETLLAGRRGVVIRALSAVDMALWDASAKRARVPLAVLLGGTTARPLPAYASGGYYRPDDGPWEAAVAREIEYNQSIGFRDHKIKVGGLPVEEDARRVAAAAQAIAAASAASVGSAGSAGSAGSVGSAGGGTGRLALDANNAYRSVPEALRAARAFERAAGELGLWWFEEPLSPDDIAGHAALAAQLDTTVATGEIHQTRWEFRDLIERRAADLLQPDAGVLGGVTEFVRVAHAAETFGIQVAPHWHANVHAQLAAATPNCLTLEHFSLDKDIYNFELLVTPETRLVIEDGAARLSDRPGLGFEFDEEVVGKHELTG